MDGMDNTDRTYVAAYSDDIWQVSSTTWGESRGESSNVGVAKPSTENNANNNNVHE